MADPSRHSFFVYRSMNSKIFSHRLAWNLTAFCTGLVLFMVACGVIASHARLFTQKRDTAVMIGSQLPVLKSTVALLSASVDAERAYSLQALAAREEQASAYILPGVSPVSRVVSALQEIVIGLDRGDELTLESQTFASTPKDTGSIKETSGTVVLQGSFRAVAELLMVIGYGGDMMVRDVLSVEDQQKFLEQVEVSAPLSLQAAEDFLYLDLVEYASSPDSAEQSILPDAQPDVVDAVRSFLLQAGLAGVRSALSHVAPHLKERKLWPLPLMRVQSIVRDGNRWTVQMIAYSR